IYINLQPIIASVVAILIGQDIFSWDEPVSAILVISGVLLVSHSQNKK
ncbi:EamA family transporter, partial [Escherichia coli]|nr:EamA family transporter [Escherichia coli]